MAHISDPIKTICLGLVKAMTHAWVLIKTTIRKRTW